MTNNPILNRLNQPQSNNMVESFNQFKKSIQTTTTPTTTG